MTNHPNRTRPRAATASWQCPAACPHRELQVSDLPPAGSPELNRTVRSRERAALEIAWNCLLVAAGGSELELAQLRHGGRAAKAMKDIRVLVPDIEEQQS